MSSADGLRDRRGGRAGASDAEMTSDKSSRLNGRSGKFSNDGWTFLFTTFWHIFPPRKLFFYHLQLSNLDKEWQCSASSTGGSLKVEKIMNFVKHARREANWFWNCYDSISLRGERKTCFPIMRQRERVTKAVKPFCMSVSEKFFMFEFQKATERRREQTNKTSCGAWARMIYVETKIHCWKRICWSWQILTFVMFSLPWWPSNDRHQFWILQQMSLLIDQLYV